MTDSELIHEYVLINVVPPGLEPVLLEQWQSYSGPELNDSNLDAIRLTQLASFTAGFMAAITTRILSDSSSKGKDLPTLLRELFP